jgi:MFS family permease
VGASRRSRGQSPNDLSAAPPSRRLRRPRGGLWDHPDFLKLWAGQSISEFGSQISQLAIPWLAAVGLHASPIQFSLLGVFGFLPFILFALPAGVWVDRLRRRPILIYGDAARALLLAIIPVLWALGALRMWQLLLIQFVVGIFTVFFDVAYQSYLPALVDRTQLVDGNAKLQVTVSTAQVAGPGLAGVLIAAITAPYAIVLDAISFVISTLFMVRIRRPELFPEREASAGKPKMLPELKEGLAYVVRHPYLRAIAACTGSSNFFGSISFTIFLLYAVRELHLSSFLVGFVFAMFGAGAIVGSLVANRVQRAIGVGPAIVAPAVLFSVAALAYPLAPKSFPIPLLALGSLLFGYGGVTYNITQVSLRQAITPERVQGRMNASMRWIVWGTLPLGQLAGGAIASAYGLRAALWVGAIGSLFTFWPVLLSPVRGIRELPEPVTEPTAAQAELAGGIVEPGPLTTEPGPPAAHA